MVLDLDVDLVVVAPSKYHRDPRLHPPKVTSNNIDKVQDQDQVQVQVQEGLLSNWVRLFQNGPQVKQIHRDM